MSVVMGAAERRVDCWPEEGVFVIRLNNEEKYELRRSGHGAIQEESIADTDACRWEHAWYVRGTAMKDQR